MDPAENPPTACVSVLVPAYNESGTIRGVILEVLAQPLVLEVLVIDDGSSDGTREILQSLHDADGRLRLFLHERNRGKGAALRTAAAHARAPIVLIQDGDSEYDPNEYGGIVAPLLDGTADVVYGSRFAGGAGLGSWHAFSNRVLTSFSNLCARQRLTDMETGVKAFRREVFERISIEEDRFGFEPEVTAKLARLEGIRIHEVPVSYRRRTLAQGKKLRWHDGAEALWCIVKYNFRGRSVPAAHARGSAGHL